MMIEDIVGNAVARLPFNNRGSETIRLTPRAECFVRAFKDNPEGGVLEIGVLEGITSLMFMDLMHKLDDLRPMQAIDCYDINIEPGYQDEYFSTFRKMLNKAECMGREFVWRLYPVSDKAYMECIHPFLSARFQKFVFVHLDGPHDTPSVFEEVDFFANHVVLGGYIIIDDFSLEDELGPMLESRLEGWKVVDIPNGIMCRRPV
jgi:hypothetical protein